ncbi:hypothetical protein GCM10023107_59790 [Actinoplanes octamycinicus]|nr:hypothetical protein Aoc01nite_71300 [Actinoplanes octamycinicus]
MGADTALSFVRERVLWFLVLALLGNARPASSPEGNGGPASVIRLAVCPGGPGMVIGAPP